MKFSSRTFVAYKSRTRYLRRRSEDLERQVALRTRQLADEKRTVEEQADRLAELEKTKDRFFANLSHEFRTPITLILGPLQDVLTGKHGRMEPGVERQLQVVRRSGRRMQGLIEQLLDLTRLEVGRLHLRLKRLDLVDVVREMVLSFSSLAERKGIVLTYRSEEEHLPAVLDPDKLEKVLANLLGNALKFTGDSGRVGVHLDQKASEADRAEIRIRDTGRGIPADEVDKVFDRFYQASNTGDTGDVGTGIGLALARELVVLHGGSIKVESEVGWGSTFT